MGESALLVEFADSAQTLQGYRMLRAAAEGNPARPNLLELVPAARTVLVAIDSRRVGLAATEAWVRSTKRPRLSVARSGQKPCEVDEPRVMRRISCSGRFQCHLAGSRKSLLSGSNWPPSITIVVPVM